MPAPIAPNARVNTLETNSAIVRMEIARGIEEFRRSVPGGLSGETMASKPRNQRGGVLMRCRRPHWVRSRSFPSTPFLRASPSLQLTSAHIESLARPPRRVPRI